ncbi:MAG: hypothetical protein M1820_001638 [Bogoriella megaspora]|nr:MAG: hypothetical protein M1820_001638 [Bogoriella megaspora]
MYHYLLLVLTTIPSDLRLNMLAKEAFLEFQNYLQAVTTKYKENWVRADSRYRPAVLVLLAVKVPEKFSHDTKAKTYLFLASSAKGAGIVYQDMAKDIKQKFPYVSNVLKSVLDECEKESEHGHRNSAACGEINALMGFFNWAKSRGISEDDARQMLHANSKSVAWWRPPVTANPKAPKREREEQQRAFDSVPSGEYRNPCSEDDTGDAKKEGFGCEAVLQHFNIRVVQRLGKNLVGNEQLFNERKAQPGEIMKTHVVSAITMAKGTNIVPVQQAAPPANNPWGKPGQSSGGG